jgi:hypothetical protein
MNRAHLALLALVALGLAAGACSGATGALPAVPLLPSTVTPSPEFVPTVVTPTPTFAGCGYVWATQNLPELSRKFNESLQTLSQRLSGLAYAFGENCVYADGHQTFSAMETDFRVGVQVNNIKNENELGDWIANVMHVVEALPAADLRGPQPGRVEFDFVQTDPNTLHLVVPIEKYRREGARLSGASLFRLFYHPTP